MKKETKILLGLTFVIAIIIVIAMISCKASPATDATDATEAADTAETSDDSDEVVSDAGTTVADSIDSCASCHDDTSLIKAREVQWENSHHGSGMTFERNSADCATCHTSEGFTERIATGTFEISEEVANPTPVNCRTCHQIHETYTSSDWALTTTEPVVIELTGDTFDGGKANLCASCHQPRASYEIPIEGGGDIEITSTRFGPHHGTQSTVLAGIGGYGEPYSGSNVHYQNVVDACVSCHMTDTAYGKQAGGHTMNVTYEYHGGTEEYLTGCLDCHTDIETFDRNGVQTEVEELLEEIRVLLVAQGLIDGESGSGIKGTFTSEQIGALWNFKTIEEDRSKGIHNPGFTKYLLETALEALQ